MISMADKQKIIKYSEQLGLSNREIARQLGINRKTVDKYIHEYRSRDLSSVSDSDSSYYFESPSYSTPERISSALTEDAISIIEECLRLNEDRESNGQKKINYKGIDIYEKLISQGYKIGYSTVCLYLSRLKKTKQEVFVKQLYDDGDVCEFDWGYIRLHICGKLRQFYIAVFTLAKSNYRYAILYQHQDTLSFQESHVDFFEHLGRVPRLMVYDNMKVAVKRFVNNKDKEPTPALLGMEAYYGFDHRFCNVRKGNEKGHVERSVEYVRRKTYVDKLEFDSIDDANKHMREKLAILNNKSLRYHDYSIREEMEKELDKMMPYRAPMECYLMEEYRVGKYSSICINTTHYSVPEKYRGEFVQAKLYANKIVIYHKNNILCQHARCYQSGQWVLSLKHYLYTLSKKPGAISGSVALSQSSDFILSLFNKHFQGESNKDFIELMIYCSENNISHDELERVYTKLIQLGQRTISKDNLIYTLGLKSSDEQAHQNKASDQHNAIYEASLNLLIEINNNSNQPCS